MTFGVTPTGFVKKVLTDILNEIKAAELDQISPTLNLLDTSVLGQLNGVFGDKLRELWDVAEAVYRAAYPDSASDEALDQVSSITGAIRLAATKSEVSLDQLFLDDGVTIPIGSVVSVGSTGARFVIAEAITNSKGYPSTFSAEAESENFGVIVGYAKTIDTIQTPIFGWNAKAAISCDIAETYNADGRDLTLKVDRGSEQTVSFSGGDPWSAAAAASEIQSQATGLKAYDAGGFVRIASDTDGEGSSIEITGGSANVAFDFDTNEIKGFNSTDAELGTDLETDPDFRSRREQLLRITGSATVDAIRARVREITDVVQAFVFENTDIETDPVSGLPPKSFETVVLGGVNQTIADVIWTNKPAGIETYGSESETVEDSQGFNHTIKFSRPTSVPIYMDLTVSTDPALFPSDGVAQIKAALKAFGDLMEVGEDVIALKFKCVPLEIAGVEDVTIFKIDDVDPPVGTVNIVIAFRDLATFDTGDIDVTVI